MYYTHVNRGTIDSNRKHGRDIPPLSVRKGKRGKSQYASEIELPPGAKIIYSAHEPLLPCGARCVIVSEEAPRIVK